jgi:N-methylhydantoinase B
MSTLDPISLAVIQNGLQQVCNEMDLAFCRAAFSPVISEGMDRSDGIYARDDGALIAQGELGLPVFVGTMQFGTRAVAEHVRRGNIPLEPDDLFIVNDPYLGGTHLMDVRFVKPFFYRGRHWCWLANTGHWPDMGGMVPGGFSANATEVEWRGPRRSPAAPAGSPPCSTATAPRSSRKPSPSCARVPRSRCAPRSRASPRASTTAMPSWTRTASATSRCTSASR